MIEKSILSMLTLLVITSCGGGGGSGSTTLAVGDPNPIQGAQNISAKFIDSPVEGLDFVRSDGSVGKTGLNGEFICKEGEIVTFKLASNTVIGNGICGEKIFLSQLGLSSGDEEAVAVAMIAMTRKNGGSSLTTLNVATPYSANSPITNSLTSLNNFLPLVGIAAISSADFTAKKTEARTHINNSLESNASTKVSLFTWLNNHRTNYWDLSDDMDLTPASSSSCPTDLSSVRFSLSLEGTSYFLTVRVDGAGVLKTRVLTERLSSSFDSSATDPDTGMNVRYQGSLSVVLSNNFTQANGFIQFKMSQGRVGSCEYPIHKDI